jgi:uncharacterized protein (DUF1800 family)
MQEREYIRAFRFGFGITNGFDFDPAQELLESRRKTAADSPLPALQERFYALAQVQRRVKQTGRDAAVVQEQRTLFAVLQQRDVHEEVANFTLSSEMFTDRLALFWSNHFSLGTGNAVVALLAGTHAKVLRHNMFGSFRALLQAAVLSPAMMQYLNLQQAVGPNSAAGQKSRRGLNENLGREILELHSLGVKGGYTQQDVGALSRLLTGWKYAQDTGEVSFAKARAEPGVKILLGHAIGSTKPLSSDLAIAFVVLARHPSTAHFIVGKLVMHFLGPGHDDLVGKLADIFTQSGGELVPVYAALIEAGEKQPLKQTQFRNDIVFLVAALRALPLRQGVLKFELQNNGRPNANLATTGALSQLRQKLWLAPSPAGWSDDADYWVSPSVMTARLRLIPRLARLAIEEEPVTWATRILGPLLRPVTRNIVSLASNRLQGMGLVLASPEFNRR